MTASIGELDLLTQMAWVKIPTPLQEHRFAPPRRWRFDFAWPDLWLALEVEGGVWSGGRHSRGAGYTADLEKYNAAALGGWTVLRVTTDMVTEGRALELVERAIARARVQAAGDPWPVRDPEGAKR